MAVPHLQQRAFVWLTPRTRGQLPFHPNLGNDPGASLNLRNFCENLEREGRRLVGTDIKEPGWFQDFTRNGWGCKRSTKLYHNTETWYAKTTQHASTDIPWDDFEGGLLHDYWLNTYDFTPEIYDRQLICSWPVYVPPPPVSEHNNPDSRQSDDVDGTSEAQSNQNSDTQDETSAVPSSRNSNTQVETPSTPASDLVSFNDFSSPRTRESSASASRGTDVRASKPVTDTIEPAPDKPVPVPDKPVPVPDKPVPVPDTRVPEPDAPKPAPEMLQPGFTLQSKSPPSACNASREAVANNELVYEIAYENLKKTSVAVPFRKRVFPVLVLTKSNFEAEGQYDPDKSFLIVQIPLDLHDVPAAHYSNSGHKCLDVADKEQKKGVVIGKYASVEHCYLRRGVPHLTHWKKALAMDVDGSSKGSNHSLLNRVAPRLLCENVDSFIQWNKHGIRPVRPVRPTLVNKVPTTEDKNPSPTAEELTRGMKRNSDGTMEPDKKSKLRKLTLRCQVL
ncbi:hypothetical protein E6O75_ATG00608 [Venturia nashicola]|uniref:DUF3074 domain-containing protein n=1 Tax=Venturia nashicola TaxID=86259 RepID=A0A4Z1PEA8_9PEZI|nr:hypothetical protein E6O75_ATG00608 [Venturia nashicola]